MLRILLPCAKSVIGFIDVATSSLQRREGDCATTHANAPTFFQHALMQLVLASASLPEKVKPLTRRLEI